MKAVADLSGSVAGIVRGAGKCEQCGGTTLLGNGCCVSCLLKENFETEVEASAEAFEGVLEEADVPDKEWRLGNYQILEEIGRGGMGVIYRARQRHSGRIVALKRVLTYHADSHETLERFRREFGNPFEVGQRRHVHDRQAGHARSGHAAHQLPDPW